MPASNSGQRRLKKESARSLKRGRRRGTPPPPAIEDEPVPPAAVVIGSNDEYVDPNSLWYLSHPSHAAKHTSDDSVEDAADDVADPPVDESDWYEEEDEEPEPESEPEPEQDAQFEPEPSLESEVDLEADAGADDGQEPEDSRSAGGRRGKRAAAYQAEDPEENEQEDHPLSGPSDRNGGSRREKRSGRTRRTKRAAAEEPQDADSAMRILQQLPSLAVPRAERDWSSLIEDGDDEAFEASLAEASERYERARALEFDTQQEDAPTVAVPTPKRPSRHDRRLGKKAERAARRAAPDPASLEHGADAPLGILHELPHVDVSAGSRFFKRARHGEAFDGRRLTAEEIAALNGEDRLFESLQALTAAPGVADDRDPEDSAPVVSAPLAAKLASFEEWVAATAGESFLEPTVERHVLPLPVLGLSPELEELDEGQDHEPENGEGWVAEHRQAFERPPSRVPVALILCVVGLMAGVVILVLATSYRKMDGTVLADGQQHALNVRTVSDRILYFQSGTAAPICAVTDNKGGEAIELEPPGRGTDSTPDDKWTPGARFLAGSGSITVQCNAAVADTLYDVQIGPAPMEPMDVAAATFEVLKPFLIAFGILGVLVVAVRRFLLAPRQREARLP